MCDVCLVLDLEVSVYSFSKQSTAGWATTVPNFHNMKTRTAITRWKERLKIMFEEGPGATAVNGITTHDHHANVRFSKLFGDEKHLDKEELEKLYEVNF